MNSIGESQRLYRCDRAYRVPETSSPQFELVFQEIVNKEQPHLILAGRDYDVVFLAKYKQKVKLENCLIPVGDSDLACMMLDKYETHLFSKKHNLPYVPTFLYRKREGMAGLEGFIEKYGFPLLVKPREGFASHGVYIIRTREQLHNTLADSTEVMFQEYLSPPEKLAEMEQDLRKGIPLFFSVPNSEHMVSQVVISKAGKILSYISTKQNLVMGRTEYAKVYEDVKLNQMIEVFASKLASLNWWGFLNLQSRQDCNGDWKVFELNPRLSGATSTRLCLGLDEIGLILSSERPEWGIPVIEENKENHVFKYLSDFTAKDIDIQTFNKEGYWSHENS